MSEKLREIVARYEELERLIQLEENYSDAEAYARSHGTTAYETLVNAGRRALKKYVR